MARGVGGKSPANVTHHLSGVDFPAKKTELIQHAKKQGADQPVIEALQNMPDREYHSMADVMKGYGESH